VESDPASDRLDVVYFVDAMDLDQISFIAATDVWHCLQFLFLRELGEITWPGDANVALRLDPGLAAFPVELMPWGCG
jgi:hypothetical protein